MLPKEPTSGMPELAAKPSAVSRLVDVNFVLPDMMPGLSPAVPTGPP